jgi:hypothetical protein
MTTASNMLNEAVGELFRMCCFLSAALFLATGFLAVSFRSME